MGRLHTLNRQLREFDSELSARCQEAPRIDVYRQGRDKCSPPFYIFSLTDNWGLRGKPVEWGIECILARLKAIDLWNQGTTSVDQILAEQDKLDESRARERKNNLESYLYDIRRGFAKATNDINTSLMDKRKGRFYGDLQ